MATYHDKLLDPISAVTAGRMQLFMQRLGEVDLPNTKLEGQVSSKASTAAVIVSGGSGERFGTPGGKQLFDILGKPLLSWSVEVFDAVPDVGHIVVVCPAERRAEYIEKAITPYNFTTPITFADSGMIRQESAMNGIAEVPANFENIIVHDGARPLITVALVAHAISALKGNMDIDGVVVGHAAIDTFKVVDGRRIAGTPDRSMFWCAQTPQVFRADVLRRAYTAAMYEGFVGTDDSSLVERIDGRITMLDGPRDNIKLTVPEDVGPVVAAMISRLMER